MKVAVYCMCRISMLDILELKVYGERYGLYGLVIFGGGWDGGGVLVLMLGRGFRKFELAKRHWVRKALMTRPLVGAIIMSSFP